MTSVLGYTDLLLSEQVGPVNDRQRKMLTSVSRNGQRLLTLIEDLLALSSVEERALRVAPERIDLRSVVERGCQVVAGKAATAGVVLEVDLGPDPVPVIGDTSQLERLAVNLLGNAVKFSAPGGVVRVTVGHAGGEALFTVADHGMGIPADEVAHLFERFYRSSNARRAEVQGSGLGLAIVKEVVAVHDGRVDIESEVGVGTTVRARLPLQAPAVPLPPVAHPRPTRPS
jgi:signal transduction histidine kinase